MVGKPFVVRIEKRNPLLIGRFEARLIGGRSPPITVVDDQFSTPLRGDLAAVVGRCIVHHDHLGRLAGLLYRDAPKRPPQESGSVVDRNDHRDRELACNRTARNIRVFHCHRTIAALSFQALGHAKRETPAAGSPGLRPVDIACPTSRHRPSRASITVIPMTTVLGPTPGDLPPCGTDPGVAGRARQDSNLSEPGGRAVSQVRSWRSRTRPTGLEPQRARRASGVTGSILA